MRTRPPYRHCEYSFRAETKSGKTLETPVNMLFTKSVIAENEANSLLSTTSVCFVPRNDELRRYAPHNLHNLRKDESAT
ncbi:MAG: hypothetical protein LBD76_03210 [Prevotellaceae bacterium]|jgi:hypothetical protein|nr:hypothetical protein [Prevotellaceae bacterium]